MNTLFKAKDFLVHLSTFCKHLFFIFRWAVNGSLTSETYSFQRHERALCFRDWLMKRQNVLCTSKTRCNSSYSRKAEVSTKKKILHFWEYSWIFTEMQQASLKVTCYAHFQHPPLNYVYRWFFANTIHSSLCVLHWILAAHCKQKVWTAGGWGCCAHRQRWVNKHLWY